MELRRTRWWIQLEHLNLRSNPHWCIGGRIWCIWGPRRKWMGQFHPVLLHLPIGIFILILFQEIVSFFRPNIKETEVGIPLILGVLSSIGAVIAGYMLWFNGDGAYGDIGERHLWSGTVFASATILVAILK